MKSSAVPSGVHGRRIVRTGPGSAAALLALSLPWLLTYSQPPSSTFINQAVAWAAWALLILLLSFRNGGRRVTALAVLAAAAPMQFIFVVLMLAAAGSLLVHGLPPSLVWSAIASLAGAALVLLAGTVFGAGPRLADAMWALFFPLVIAAVLSSLIAAVQIFHSDWAGNALVSASAYVERASGNLRQPNHLSSLAVWAIVGVVWLRESSALPRFAAWLIALSLVATIVLTGSRTGVLGILMLAAWALIDRNLSGPTRRLLWALPVAYAAGWWLFKWWASNSLGSGEIVDRIATGGDISNARFAIWSNTLDLIRQHPLFGVGFGEFNLAWTLTPFPGRPTQFYDHSHNLVLQWLVELGIPFGTLLLIAAGITLWRCFRAARDAGAEDRLAYSSVLMLILLILLHSLLEYPLWYVHFLLPTMFAIGIGLAASGSMRHRDAVRTAETAAPLSGRLLGLGAILMVGVTVFAIYDYQKIVVIFSPPANAAPLAQRIADGKRSIFFAHHAHYAQATTAEHPSQVLSAFESASHFLLDTRLMLAWTTAWNELGDQARARHLADRLREFGNPASQPFFSVCENRPPGTQAVPYQCQPASQPLDLRAFR